jgi:hypothetical protein
VTFFNKQRVFVLFTLTVVLALLLPALLQHGMFMDGMQYAIVAKNLALNKATFWMPYLSSSWSKMYSNYFLEHPPLVYYLQSKFFLVFGNGVFTEKIYCFFAFAICAFLISKIWCLIFKDDQQIKNYWWLAVLLWFITPSVFWSFANNMLENTLTIMVLAASYFALKAIYSNGFNLVYIFIAGCFVFLGSLSKGLPGLFPISIIVCGYFLLSKPILKKTIIYTVVLIIIPTIIYFLFFKFNAEAKESLTFYIKNRLLNRISEAHTVENRFSILFWLFTDQLVNIALCIVLFLVFKAKLFVNELSKKENKLILFFLFYGLSGVVPLCFTHVQRAVYFVPALPFFGIGVAVFLAKGLNVLITKIKDEHFKIIRSSVIVLFFITLLYLVSLIGKTGRDEKVLSEITKIGSVIGNDKVIGTTNELYEKWDYQFYLLRYYNITLEPSTNKQGSYKLIDKQTIKDTVNYQKVNVDLEKYILYKKRN